MQRQQSFAKNEEGCLYLVPTPIGNLQDMTYRSVATLQEVDVIAAEDTRNTIKLLNHFAITTPQVSLHEHNYQERIPQLLARLKAGEKIAQVSDAGMPSISDPGHELVLACVTEGIPVIALPGATAGMTALIASGLTPQPFTFIGFLPRKKSQQVEALAAYTQSCGTLIFYESPFRLKDTLKNVAAVFHDPQVVICRELTKIHEEYLRGQASELIGYLEETSLKGECVLLVAPTEFPEEVSRDEDLTLLPIAEHFAHLKAAGLTDKEIIKTVASARQMKKQEVYKIFHELV